MVKFPKNREIYLATTKEVVMLLLFKPRDAKYLGTGTLPFGSFDNTAE